MYIIEPILYEYANPNMKVVYENQKLSRNFFYHNTFEIYNKDLKIWITFTPNLINYTKDNILDKHIKKSVYYIIKYDSVPKIDDFPKLKGLQFSFKKSQYKDCVDYKIFSEKYDNELRELVYKYITNGTYYKTYINDFIIDEDDKLSIKIRPIKATTGYRFGFDPHYITDNYWVKKHNINIVIEEEAYN